SPTAETGDITLLFMGNSHTAFHDVPGTVAALVRAARPGRTVAARQAPGGMFLEERATDAANLALLDSQRWTFVVLQAQKYSTSGLFSYPIDGAVELARHARERGAVPIMFPEWPRRDVDETQRIFDLHVSIAQRVPACVAPIGQAWDRALAQYPGLVLHDSDGNHSTPAGAFLAALVIASTMTGARPDALPFVAGAGVEADLQARLRTVAAEAVALTPPRQWCPGDPLPP
ncbi:MAG TPA: hypothetical protein VFV90_08435, partial [Usitatibacter sp.]|nr:hypothetical protein [Usitatibacter sp.]